MISPWVAYVSAFDRQLWLCEVATDEEWAEIQRKVNEAAAKWCEEEPS